MIEGRGLAVLAAVMGLALASAPMARGEERIESISEAQGYKELVYREDILVEERKFDEFGALLEERRFDSASLPIETRAYIRKDGHLIRVEVRDQDGEATGSRSYHYDSAGRLLGLSSEGSLGKGAAGVISSGSSPQASWTADTTTTVLGYDENGRVVLTQSMKDGSALSVERRSYGEKGALASIRFEDRKAGSSRDSAYDEKGRLVSRTDTPAKGTSEKTAYRYDDADRLIEELRQKGSHRTIISKAYDEAGSLVREETRLDGELALVVEYLEGGRVEELYEDGLPFVRASYSGGRKVKDEFFAGGKLARTREYQ